MHTLARLAFAAFALTLCSVSLQAEEKLAEGEISLFNGKELTGWGYKSGAKFDGKTEADDKR